MTHAQHSLLQMHQLAGARQAKVGVGQVLGGPGGTVLGAGTAGPRVIILINAMMLTSTGHKTQPHMAWNSPS